MAEDVPVYDVDGNPVDDPDLSVGFLSNNYVLDDDGVRLVSHTYRVYTEEDRKAVARDKFLNDAPDRLDSVEQSQNEIVLALADMIGA